MLNTLVMSKRIFYVTLAVTSSALCKWEGFIKFIILDLYNKLELEDKDKYKP